jgi:hypothetical protein
MRLISKRQKDTHQVEHRQEAVRNVMVLADKEKVVASIKSLTVASKDIANRNLVINPETRIIKIKESQRANLHIKEMFQVDTLPKMITTIKMLEVVMNLIET